MTAEDVRAFLCPGCNGPTSSPVLGIATSYDPEGLPAEYAFLQCGRCERPLLQLREDYGNGFEQDEPIFIYPSPRRLSIGIPSKLRSEFDEARKCFDAKAYGATVVMIRRTLEGTCQNQGIKGRNLATNLKALRDKGLIDGTLGEWADLLRVVGNEGAHYTGNAVAREDAEDALDFAEALLDHLYVLRKRFDEFRARRIPPSTA